MKLHVVWVEGCARSFLVLFSTGTTENSGVYQGFAVAGISLQNK